MIESTVISCLTLNLSNVPVYAEVPRNKTNKYIVIEKIDGGLVDGISAATISVESYANSLFDASLLDEEVRSILLNDLLEYDNVSGSKLGGNSCDIDTDTNEYRYNSIFNIYFYE